jgi:HNH endonuclease
MITLEFLRATARRNKRECWQWDSAHDDRGYALIGKGQRLYRIMHQLLIGPVLKNKVLHHTCHNPSCVNPYHLEMLTPTQHFIIHGVNDRKKLKTHCKYGHPLSGDNIYIYGTRRHCKTCRKIYAEKKREARHGR